MGLNMAKKKSKSSKGSKEQEMTVAKKSKTILKRKQVCQDKRQTKKTARRDFLIKNVKGNRPSRRDWSCRGSPARSRGCSTDWPSPTCTALPGTSRGSTTQIVEIMSTRLWQVTETVSTSLLVIIIYCPSRFIAWFSCSRDCGDPRQDDHGALHAGGHPPRQRGHRGRGLHPPGGCPQVQLRVYDH